MSIECAECEHDLRGGHGVGCSRYVAPPTCPQCGKPLDGDEGWHCENAACPRRGKLVSDDAIAQAYEAWTCDRCHSDHVRMTIALCPLHAEAEAMRDVLKRMWEAIEGLYPAYRSRDLDLALSAARPILARIDGAAAPAERGQ